jgi:hypothetical protein
MKVKRGNAKVGSETPLHIRVMFQGLFHAPFGTSNGAVDGVC